MLIEQLGSKFIVTSIYSKKDNNLNCGSQLFQVKGLLSASSPDKCYSFENFAYNCGSGREKNYGLYFIMSYPSVYCFIFLLYSAVLWAGIWKLPVGWLHLTVLAKTILEIHMHMHALHFSHILSEVFPFLYSIDTSKYC